MTDTKPATRHAVADAAHFINRETSWLAFNERVIEEAADATVPLFERLKFVAIAASNLDEFFMVRVAGLKRAVEDNDASPDPSGLTPTQQLAAVRERSRAMVHRIGSLWSDTLRPLLKQAGVTLVSWEALSPGQQAGLSQSFAETILPVLTPLAIDRARPFPLLTSLSLNLALLLEAARDELEPRVAVVRVPSRLNRLLPVDGGKGRTFALLEDVIRAHVGQLFPGQAVRETTMIRLARDAELELDAEGGLTRLEQVEREVRQRRRSDVVRVEIDAAASAELIQLVSDQIDVDPEDIYPQRGPLDLRVLMSLTEIPGFEAYRDPPLQPVNPLATDQRDLFSILDERDILLHHPYESYDPVLAFLAQAAEDPDVLAIKQTLYRASSGSPIIASLKRAAECNKEVTVLVEVTARFDEERNIQWARTLEEAGAHVIYGVRGYKTHAKVCLVIRRTASGLKRYTHVGTGNYNERTARLYTDFGLMTTSPDIAADASAFFSTLTGYSDPPRLKKLVMAPTGLRDRFLKLIDRERRRAEAGDPAEIVAKMNALVDVDTVEALYAASKAGVKIRLNVRGICVLRPGLKGLSENIQVVSIVDRFLEHARAYVFHNGGEEQVFLASADWMSRNLDKRIELMFPIEDDSQKARVMQALRAMFRDNVKSRWLQPAGTYERRPRASGEPPLRVQTFLLDETRRAADLARGTQSVTFIPEERKAPGEGKLATLRPPAR